MKYSFAMLLAISLPLAAGAQTPSDLPAPAGITATGKGVARATVTTALVRVVAAGVVDESGLVDALHAAAVENIVTDRGRPQPAGVALLAVRGRISNATSARLDVVAAAAGHYADAHSGTSIVAVRFFGPAEDCPAIEQRAREAAIEDARRRATAIAVMNHTPLGPQIAVAETGGCPQVGPSGGAFAIEPATMSMRVAIEETVTFALAK